MHHIQPAFNSLIFSKIFRSNWIIYRCLQVVNVNIHFNHVSIFTINQNLVDKLNEILWNIFNSVHIGKYWIDPNHGSTTDAFEVQCLLESGRKKTCIEPLNNHSQEIQYVSLSQLRFLRILYNQIEQNFTSECYSSSSSMNVTVTSLDDIHYDLYQLSNLIIINECQVNLLI